MSVQSLLAASTQHLVLQLQPLDGLVQLVRLLAQKAAIAGGPFPGLLQQTGDLLATVVVRARVDGFNCGIVIGSGTVMTEAIRDWWIEIERRR